jgi:hypothetical protein
LEERRLCQAVLSHLEITLVRGDAVHKKRTATDENTTKYSNLFNCE